MYRQSECLFLCYQMRVIQNCSCYDLYHPKLVNITPCVSKENIECNDKEYDRFMSSQIEPDCLAQCPLECDSIDYGVSISSSNFPSKYFHDLYKDFLKNSDYESSKKTLYRIYVYYPSLGYTRVSEFPKTSVIDLLSSIGGTLGLYLGVSFLSLIEFVEILLEIFFISID